MIPGISSETILRPASISEEELLELIAKLNSDAAVDGLLVQLPLPGEQLSSPSCTPTELPRAAGWGILPCPPPQQQLLQGSVSGPGIYSCGGVSASPAASVPENPLGVSRAGPAWCSQCPGLGAASLRLGVLGRVRPHTLKGLQGHSSSLG